MTPWVTRLLIANIAVFVLQLAQPWVTDAFMFVPAHVVGRPWTIITYMFLHDPSGFGHIFFNMLALYFFGPRVESRIGSSRFIKLYMISGISGALLHLIMGFADAFLPGALAFAGRSPIVGASGAVFGVMLAFAYFWP